MPRPIAVLRSPWGLTLVYNLLVILFGAYVRISKSGDGCGQHWPTCHGEVIHLPRKIETVIELTHRLTSGLSLILVLGLAVLTLRRHAPGHPARAAARWAMVFIVSEALVGAAIVLLRLVGEDSSLARAAVMAVHLINTCLLTFALLLAAISSGRSPAPDFRFADRRMRWAWWGAALLLLISAAGAVTALGDTLFPVTDHATVARNASTASAHFLERVRGFHPLLATAGAVFLVWASSRLGTSAGARQAVVGLVYLQVALGLVNVWLSAPGWMQVVHLGVANLLWLAWSWLLLETAEGPKLG